MVPPAPILPAAGMTARTRTLLVTLLIGVVLFVLALTRTVDYVALGPGEADNTLGYKNGTQIIKISGAAQETGTPNAQGQVTYPGQLLLTTVSVGPKLTLGQAIQKWLDRNYAVVPYDVVYPPTMTTDQTNAQNAQDMTESQDDATTAALDLLGKPEIITVDTIEPKTGGVGKLLQGDVLTAIDGKPVAGYSSLRKLLSGVKPGAMATVKLTRKGVPMTVTFPTTAAGDGTGRAILGIQPAATSPIKVTITNQNVGGPSAGMMYALGIINKLSPPADQLTGNRIIAGTGTIDPLGDVGDIGGIQEKLLGAKAAGATVFLVPAGNCAEAARAHVAGLQLVQIPDVEPASAFAPSNLMTAYDALKQLEAGNGSTLKSC